MKILLINPPKFNDFYPDRDSMGGFGNINHINKIVKEKDVVHRHPMNLLYAGSVLEKLGHDVKIIDYIYLQKIGKFVDERIYKEYDIAFVLIGFPSLKYDCQFVEGIKDRIKTVLVGDVLKYYYNEAISICNTLITVGELEITIPKILDNIKEYDWKYTSPVFENEYVNKLDFLPFPAWHLIYKKEDFSKLTMLTTRGCFHGCIYCPYPIAQGSKYRQRSVECIVSEIIYLKKRFNIKYILMRDPLFTYNKEKVIELCKQIKNKRINIKWGIETRPEYLDCKILSCLYESGCTKISIGIESANINTLSQSRGGFSKDTYLEKIRDNIRIMKKLKIDISIFFVIGLPDDTKESIEESIKFAEELCVDYTQFSLATPYPDTKLDKIGKELNLIKYKDFIDCDAFNNPSMATKFLSIEEIKKIYDNIQRRVEIISNKRRLERIKNGDFTLVSLFKYWKNNFINADSYKMLFNTLRS